MNLVLFLLGFLVLRRRSQNRSERIIKRHLRHFYRIGRVLLGFRGWFSHVQF
jgi:hypothetical protein